MTKVEDILYVTIQSAGRPQNVKPMQDALAPLKANWFVPFEQCADYQAAGAYNVIPVTGKLPMKPLQLNTALKYGWGYGKIVVTMDDDYVSTKKVFTRPDGKIGSKDVSLYDFIMEVFMEFAESPYCLAGVTTNLNPLWAAEATTNHGMITGQVLFHKTNFVQFDESLPMMEDLDLVIHHHIRHKGVMKVRRFVQEFHMMGRNDKSDATHDGGYARLRNEERLALAVEIMNHKYRNFDEVVIENNGLGNSSHKKVNFRKLTENPQVFL